MKSSWTKYVFAFVFLILVYMMTCPVEPFIVNIGSNGGIVLNEEDTMSLLTVFFNITEPLSKKDIVDVLNILRKSQIEHARSFDADISNDDALQKYMRGLDEVSRKRVTHIYNTDEEIKTKIDSLIANESASNADATFIKSKMFDKDSTIDEFKERVKMMSLFVSPVEFISNMLPERTTNQVNPIQTQTPIHIQTQPQTQPTTPNVPAPIPVPVIDMSERVTVVNTSGISTISNVNDVMKVEKYLNVRSVTIPDGYHINVTEVDTGTGPRKVTVTRKSLSGNYKSITFEIVKVTPVVSGFTGWRIK